MIITKWKVQNIDVNKLLFLIYYFLNHFYDVKYNANKKYFLKKKSFLIILMKCINGW